MPVILQSTKSRLNEVVRLRSRLQTDAPDPEVIAEAEQLDAILLSLNGDFSDLIRYPPPEFGGIVTLQVKGRLEVLKQLVQRLVGYLKAHPSREHYRGKLLVVEAHRIRVRGNATQPFRIRSLPRPLGSAWVAVRFLPD